MLVNGVNTHRDSCAASHMPVLMEFIEKFSPQRALEFGSGNYSTGLLTLSVPHVISIEMEHEEWYAMIGEKYKGRAARWEYEFRPSLREAHDWLSSRAEPFVPDLIFVDDGEERASETNLAFTLAKTIVVHDAQHRWRDAILRPTNFAEINFTKFPIRYPDQYNMYDIRPWTTMYTSDPVVFDHFDQIEESLYEKFEFPYIFDAPPERA